MKPAQITLINGLVLIVLSIWAYFSSVTPSFTAFIPSFFGIIFIALTPSFRKGNRVVAHIVVVLTVLLLIALIKPLSGALDRDDMIAILRIAVMMGVSLLALIIYIRSFIDARRK